MNGLVDKKFCNFDNYISKLRTLEDYVYVGEETALATAELINREVHIYCALSEPQVYIPFSSVILHEPLKIAFYEPAHFKALAALSSQDKPAHFFKMSKSENLTHPT